MNVLYHQMLGVVSEKVNYNLKAQEVNHESVKLCYQSAMVSLNQPLLDNLRKLIVN